MVIMEDGYGWVIFGGVVTFFGGLFAYLMFMIFLPEWVGITGKTALAAEASHREDVSQPMAATVESTARLPSESVASELVPEASRLVESASFDPADPSSKPQS